MEMDTDVLRSSYLSDGADNTLDRCRQAICPDRGVPQGHQDRDVSGMWSDQYVMEEPVLCISQSEENHPLQIYSGNPLSSLFQFCDRLDLDNRNCNVSSKSWRHNQTSRKSLQNSTKHFDDKFRVGSLKRSWHRPAKFLTEKDSAPAQKSRLFDVSIRHTRNESSTDSHDETYNKENHSELSVETVHPNTRSENFNPNNVYTSIMKCDMFENSTPANSTNSGHIQDTSGIFHYNWSKFGRCTVNEMAKRRRYILDCVQTVELEPQGQSISPNQLPETGSVEDSHREKGTLEVSLQLLPPAKSDYRTSSSPGSTEAIADVSNQNSLTDFYELITAFDKSPKKIHSNLSNKFSVLKSALGPTRAWSMASEASVPVSSPSVWVDSSSVSQVKKTYECKYCKKSTSLRALKRHVQQSYRCGCGRRFCLLDMLNKHKKTCSIAL